MRRSRPLQVHVPIVKALFLATTALLLAGCAGSEQGVAVTAFEGARVIPGDGSAAIEDAVLLVENGRLTLPPAIR
ncbi:MAG: hypothetical protein EXR91_06695 [Gemmatimonadetes bacterium]|nr:hypothetical protein [Gemmatimonadota bacterium]